MFLRASGFDPYRCDRNLSLGINLGSLSKVVKTAGNDDTVTISSDDDADTLGLKFESPSEHLICFLDLEPRLIFPFALARLLCFIIVRRREGVRVHAQAYGH